ncbi:MAG TPA: monovalent cation/H+ antiporter complex subunit F [Candidatus Thermoplasmatota archaeon]|nr:monovalent cation/H+ antiporter complex subunit F [Candidatus Thermoplasmatota archaeon]
MTHTPLPEPLLEALMVFVAAGALLPLARLVKGPSLADRAVAFDLIAMAVLALACLEAMRSGRGVFLDAAVVLAILTFVATVAIAQFLAPARSLAPTPGRSGPDGPRGGA